MLEMRFGLAALGMGLGTISLSAYRGWRNDAVVTPCPMMPQLTCFRSTTSRLDRYNPHGPPLHVLAAVRGPRP